MAHKRVKNTLCIIIPAKNESKIIGRCLCSLKRSIEVWDGFAEVIVVDNGSTDETIEIATRNGCKVIQKEGGGVSGLRNIGCFSSKSDIVAFLDADCLVAPNWISSCFEHFSDQTIVAVGTRAIPDLENATWVEMMWYRLMSGAKRPDFVEWLGTSNLFVRREVFEAIGGFDESLETGEDVNLCYRLREGHNILLEKRIKTIHLRESKTVIELFKREYWRGKNSLKSFSENNFKKKECLSVVVPGVNLCAIISLPLLMINPSCLATIPALIVLGFPLLLMSKKKIKLNLFRDGVRCYIVAFVYIFARSCSLGRECWSLCFSK